MGRPCRPQLDGAADADLIRSLFVLCHHRELFGMPAGFAEHLSEVRVAMDAAGIPRTDGWSLIKGMSKFRANKGQIIGAAMPVRRRRACL